MSNSKISALTSATTPLAGTETLPIVQSSTTKKVAVASMFGTNVYTFLNTPTSANLAAAVTDETGSGALVFGTNPTFSNTGGNPSANFTNTIYQDVNVNFYGASGSVGSKLNLNFGDNGSTNNIGSFTVYGSAYGGGSNNRMDFGNANGRFGISSAGNGFLSTGNLEVANGKGIDFSATPGTGTSELFADYEEGTWTPDQGSGLTVVGAFSSVGYYTKVGNLVTITGYVKGATSVACTAVGIICTNAPYAGGVSGIFWTGASMNWNANSGGSCGVQQATTNIYSAVAITASDRISFTITYRV